MTAQRLQHLLPALTTGVLVEAAGKGHGEKLAGRKGT